MGRPVAAVLGLLLFTFGPAERLIRAQLPHRAGHECTCNEVVCRCGHRPAAPASPADCHGEETATLRSCGGADNDEAPVTSVYVLPTALALAAPQPVGPTCPSLVECAQPPTLEILAPPPKPSHS